ncbi:dolichol kinase [Infirmifilum sp. NZ]|uniref:dolichol kinase n=1 Tax=Infirmifilum sp. NZ TaxID=2926850 RepID=UPI0027A6059E|nr:dolichol kinase [Infirmifilum sp. NZ]UNQ73937.1 dolichol kinase [Infirmifilum sp. NZ]
MHPILSEILNAVLLLAWVLFVVIVIARVTYNYFAKRETHKVAIYYARKVIHILAGGLVALLIALYPLFETPLVPFVMGLLLAVFTYIPHKTGKLMYWFQDPDNIYEVDFCIMWAIFITLGWFAGKQLGYNSPFLFGALPLLFMAVGDGVTGIVRNALFKRRVKHWSGNLAMFIVSAAMALALNFGLSGVLSALAASLVERVEYLGGLRLDDNITVPIASFATLYVLQLMGIF